MILSFTVNHVHIYHVMPFTLNHEMHRHYTVSLLWFLSMSCSCNRLSYHCYITVISLSYHCHITIVFIRYHATLLSDALFVYYAVTAYSSSLPLSLSLYFGEYWLWYRDQYHAHCNFGDIAPKDNTLPLSMYGASAKSYILSVWAPL